MKRYLLLFFLPLFFLAKAKCQSIPDSVDFAVRFGSICCGPDSDIFLKEYVKQFNKGKCRKVNGYKAGGCGKEGEFIIFLSVKKLSEARKKAFTIELEELVDRENLKNKAANGTAGGIRLQHEKRISDYSYCRLAVAKWK